MTQPLSTALRERVGRPVIVAGHVCVDLTPRMGAVRVEPGRLIDVGPMKVELGGCVANTGRALLSLGVDVEAHVTLGDDELGRLAGHLLTASGLRARVNTAPAAGTAYSIVLEPTGVDRSFWHYAGANASFDGSRIEASGVDLVHVGYPSLLPGLLVDSAEPLVALLRRLRSAGATTSVDLAVTDPTIPDGRDWAVMLPRVAAETDVMTPSLDDLASAFGIEPPYPDGLADDFAARLLDWGVAVVAVSDGRNGLLLRVADAGRLRAAGRALAPLADSWAGARLRVPAVEIEAPHTTTGAGDASTAGLLAGMLAGVSPREAAELATASASAVICGASPTWESVPRLRESVGGPSVVELAANQPSGRFYRGGERIAAFRGTDAADPYTPEDWIGSTVAVRGEDGLSGLTRLPDGRLLRDAITADPVGWLGREHVARFGSDPRLLVKLLDAGQRLPIHAHPDCAFAAEALGTAHGKSEAWYFLNDGEVYLGLTRDVSASDLLMLVEQQRTVELLDAMHRIRVGVGDRIFVPAGQLHAIGSDLLLTEVQEPEDLSVLLEWKGFELDGAADGHLGLGFERALSAVRRRRTDRTDLDRVILRAGSGEGLPSLADPFFRLDRLDVDGATESVGGFAVLIGLAGAVDLTSESGCTTISRGVTLLLPAAVGVPTLSGRGTVLVARPPLA